MPSHILFVEDDASLGETTSIALERAGFRVSLEGNGERALARFDRRTYDLVLLDLLLPSLDGLEVCRRIRSSSNVPILILTAKCDTIDVVVGLEVGADDYLRKPFELAELVARVRALLRRSRGLANSARIKLDGVEIDPAAHIARKHGRELTLSKTEFTLLLELARHTGTVLRRDVLLERVWDYNYMGDSRLVDMAIKRLRDKVEDDPKHPRLIETVRGVGYLIRTERQRR